MKKIRVKLTDPLTTIQEIVEKVDKENPVKPIEVVIEVDSFLEIPERQEISEKSIEEFEKLISSYKINLKDIREIISLSETYWKVRKVDPWCEDRIVLNYHMINKGEKSEKTYSEEIILSTLRGLAKAKSYIEDFYVRIKSIDPQAYETFEEYYKELYGNN